MADEPQDLKILGSPESESDEPETFGDRFTEEPFNRDKEQEAVRGKIALRLVWALVGVIFLVVATGVIIGIVCIRSEACSTEVMELKSMRAVIELVLTPLVGLVGAVTGFYFGEKSGRDRGEPGTA